MIHRCTVCGRVFVPWTRYFKNRGGKRYEGAARHCSPSCTARDPEIRKRSDEARSESAYRKAILDAVELLESRPDGFEAEDVPRKNVRRLRERLGLLLLWDHKEHRYLWSPVDVKRVRQLEAALLRTQEAS